MTIQGVSFHPSPGGQFSAVVDTVPSMAKTPEEDT
jgi:hypothetical protein